MYKDFVNDVYLESAFDNVEGGHKQMGDAASQETPEPAVGVKLVASKLARILRTAEKIYILVYLSLTI